MIALQPTRIDFGLLRNDVHQVLADLGQLESGSFPMTERLVVRGDDDCGIYFCLHGPRNVKLTAIRDLKRPKVIDYGTDGLRMPAVPDQSEITIELGDDLLAGSEAAAARCFGRS